MISVIRRALLPLVSGAAAVLAFAPLGWYPVAVPALAVLFHGWRQAAPRQAFVQGALFGIGYFGAGVSWVYVSIHTYGHVAAPGAALVAVLFILVLSLYPALLGYLLRRYLPGQGWGVLAGAMPAGWLLAEWLRGWLFSGFPWLNIGASQVDGPLAGYLPLLGEYGAGWLVALSAGLLLALLHTRQRIVSALLLAAIWAGGWLLERADWVQARGEALTVSLVQGNVAQEQKWLPENMEGTLALYAELTFTGPRADLVVWPETAIPAFYHEVDEGYLPVIEERLAQRQSSLLTGIPVLDRTSWDYYNAILALDGEQSLYFKQHLVAFGEYLPLRWLIGDTLDALAVPNADFTPGAAGQPLLQAAGYPAGTSICFEVAFGRLIAASVPEAALLVNVSNDGWFGDSLAPHQHLEIARVRALETGRPLLRATNTGISAIIDHHGRITARSPQFSQAVVTGSVLPMQGMTPFVRFGNWPVVILGVLILLAAGVAGRRNG
ncbi:MAG: apolipoprotein N-acyltransferase [Gammaproteobacteria bacterium]